MKKNYFLVLLLLAVSATAQEQRLKKTDNAFEHLAYMDVVKIYEKAVRKGYGTPDIYQKLGDAYYFNAQYPVANNWYGKVMETAAEVNPEYYFRYAQTLKSVGEPEKAKEYLEKFAAAKKEDSRNHKSEHHNEPLHKTDEYQLEDAGINTELSDYGAALYNGQLVFTSSRKTQNQSAKVHQWTNQPFTDLYSTPILPVEELGKNIRNFDPAINTKYNEASAVFTKDGTTMYFTANNNAGQSKKKNTTENSYLNIYKATYNNGKWGNIFLLPFNGTTFNCAHPALSNDEKKLFFVSDRPGSLGQSDIFVVTIEENGQYSNPVNLGQSVNTEGRETFPYLAQDGTLYFASDGHPGLGGLDIFKADGENFANIENLGTPFNSPYDDFAYTQNTTKNEGFLSSNRPGGKGHDDIYRFSRKSASLSPYKLSGQITDQETGKGIAKAVVTLFDTAYTPINSLLTDSNGYYQWESAQLQREILVRTEAEHYHTQETHLAPDRRTILEHNVPLNKQQHDVVVGKDLAKAFGIEDIHFGLDQWDITKEAEAKLGLLLVLLQEYPTIKLEIRSHTDSRATKDYNQTLSEKRAKATRDWLIKNGIAGQRLLDKGLGETQPINNCTDGMPCSEEEHRQNRRSGFVIVGK